MSASGGTRQEQKQRTHDLLIEAARECFTKKGFAATTIPEIVKQANVAHGTFYVHFATKEALLDELLEGFNHALSQRMGPVLLNADQGREALVRAAAREFLAQLEAEPLFVSWYIERIASGIPASAVKDGINPPMFELLRVALKAELDTQTEDSIGIDLVAHALLAMWIRIGLQATLSQAVTRERAEDILVKMTVGAIDGLKPTKKTSQKKSSK